MMNLSSVAQGIGNFITKYLLERFIIICHTNAHTIFFIYCILSYSRVPKREFSQDQTMHHGDPSGWSPASITQIKLQHKIFYDAYWRCIVDCFEPTDDQNAVQVIMITLMWATMSIFDLLFYLASFRMIFRIRTRFTMSKMFMRINSATLLMYLFN